jgi:hypothetical protein
LKFSPGAAGGAAVDISLPLLRHALAVNADAPTPIEAAGLLASPAPRWT